MTAEHILALDLGTTRVRALVVHAERGVVARANSALGAQHPAPGYVEQDPNEMWQSSRDVLRAAMADAGVCAGDIAGIGVVTQRSTAVAWDAQTGQPLCPAIGWQDQRNAELVAAHRARGIPITTLPSATKFEWWMGHEPAVRRAASEGRLRLGTPDAWLTHCLTGGAAYVTDPGQASCTGLYNLELCNWSAEAANLFGIDVAILPQIRASSEVVGETPRELLGASVPVAARAGDQQAASFAHGVRAPGDAKLTLGTSAMLDVCSTNRSADVAHGAFPLVLWRLEDGADVHCVEGHVITAGAVIDWLVGLGLLSSAPAIDDLAGQAQTSEGVTFVPALQGLGTPYSDLAARGLLGGLTRGTRAAHVARAALEGIAHRCVDLFDSARLGDAILRVDGGLAQSDLLLQILTDLAGRPLERAAEIETTALGAAQLAGLVVGTWANPETFGGSSGAPTRFEPRIGPDERSDRRRRWRAAVERAGSAA